MLQVVDRRPLMRERLSADAVDVIAQRNRRRAEIRAVLREPAGAFAAHVGQFVLIVAHRGRAAVNNHLVRLHLAQKLIDQLVRQLNLVGSFAATGVAAGEKELQQQRLDKALAELRLFERRRFDGHELRRRRCEHRRDE